jgi:hypothetical protein
MQLKPRHVVAALLLIAEAAILAPVVAGWLISAVIYGMALAVEHARPRVRTAVAHAGQRIRRLFSWRRWRRPPRPGRPAWGW